MTSRALRFAALGSVVGLLALSPSGAGAAPSFPLEVDSRAVLPGSLETVVELRNTTDVAVSGRVELSTPEYRGGIAGGTTQVPVAEKPFTLGPKATGRVTLVATAHGRHEITARVVLDDGGQVHESTQNAGRYFGISSHVFVDLGGHGTLLGALNDTQVPTTSSSGSTREHLSANAPPTMGSGATPLPTTLGGYSSASVVHVESTQLLRLEQAELVALVDWIARGGTLAVSVDDPAQLAEDRFTALLGGRAAAHPTDAGLFGDAPLIARQEATATDDSSPPDRARPIPNGPPLLEFTGGNLETSELGSVAAYGIGRVVLLPYRAATRTDDPWVVGKLAELTIDSTSHGSWSISAIDGNGSDVERSSLKRSLDPNQRFRVSLGVTTAGLLAYAGLVAFLLIRDNRRRRFFRPFVWLPVLAGSVSLAIVLLGIVSRGNQRGVRRVVLFESGAGFGLVSVDEYRGYFSSGSDTLTIASQSPRSLLYSSVLGPLHHRDGFTFFQGKPQLPWQTTLTRELRMEQSTQSIAVGEDGGVPWVTNHTTTTLEDVIVTVRDGTMFLFPSIAPRESVIGNDSLQVSALPASFQFGLRAHMFDKLDADAAERLENRYELLSVLGEGQELRATGVTTLLARATGGTPFLTQADPPPGETLPVSTLATFVYVVGTGGSR